MTQTNSTATTAGTTRALLGCGVAAGPLYVVVAAAQVLTRDGFDMTRHPVSLLSNGDLGWIQIANFVVTGLLTVACAAGMRRALDGGRGRTWGPLLVGVYGAGVFAGGIFVADPVDGFPPGTPAGAPQVLSWHGMLHFVFGGLGFLAVIAACMVFAVRYASLGRRGWAAYSAATGVIFLATYAATMTGAGQAWAMVALYVGVLLAWTWVSVTAGRLITRR